MVCALLPDAVAVVQDGRDQLVPQVCILHDHLKINFVHCNNIQISMNVADPTTVNNVASTLQEAILVAVGQATLCSQMDALAEVNYNECLRVVSYIVSEMLNQYVTIVLPNKSRLHCPPKR